MDGEKLGQSYAIARYLARKFGKSQNLTYLIFTQLRYQATQMFRETAPRFLLFSNILTARQPAKVGHYITFMCVKFILHKAAYDQIENSSKYTLP